MMTLRETVTMATVAASDPLLVFDMLKAGKVDPDAWALIVKGSQRYVTALAAGDIADFHHQAARVKSCRICPSAIVAVSPGSVTGREYVWCGVPLKPLEANEYAQGNPKADRPEWADVKWDRVVGPACGCCLDLKWLVASEACPQGRWGAVRAALTLEGKVVPKGV